MRAIDVGAANAAEEIQEISMARWGIRPAARRVVTAAARSDVTADQERPYLLSTVSTFLREFTDWSIQVVYTYRRVFAGPDICTHSMTFRFVRFCPHLRSQ